MIANDSSICDWLGDFVLLLRTLSQVKQFFFFLQMNIKSHESLFRFPYATYWMYSSTTVPFYRLFWKWFLGHCRGVYRLLADGRTRCALFSFCFSFVLCNWIGQSVAVSVCISLSHTHTLRLSLSLSGLLPLWHQDYCSWRLSLRQGYIIVSYYFPEAFYTPYQGKNWLLIFRKMCVNM